MDSAHLETFCLCAHTGSFSKAASLQNLSQPSVSGRIRSLENELGVRLFQRDGHTLTLTEAGRKLLPRAEQAVRLVERMRAEVDRGRSLLHVAMTPVPGVFLLPGCIVAFQAKNPGAELRVYTAQPYEVAEYVANGTADVGIGPDIGERYGICRQLVREDPVVAVVSSAHELAQRERVPLDELVRYPVIAFGAHRFDLYWTEIENRFLSAGLEFHSVTDVDNPGIILRLVAAGASFSVLPWVVARAEVERGRLAVLQTEPDLGLSQRLAAFTPPKPTELAVAFLHEVHRSWKAAGTLALTSLFAGA